MKGYCMTSNGKCQSNLLPALILFFLSPWIGEVISGFLSVEQFFKPLRLLITLPPYGCGALIARELVVRNRKSWPGLFMFGLAFGIFFEAIITRVFVNPEPGILSAQAIAYQRVLGWNWANTIGVTHFHALLAIAAPVFLTEMLFPKQRGESWIGTPVLWICVLVMLVWPFVLGLIADYVPSVPVALSAIALTGLFIALGLAMPACVFSSQHRRARHPFWMFLVCTLAMALVMIGGSAIPDGATPPPLPALLGVMLVVILIEFLMLAFLTCGHSFDDRHRLSMALGWMMFFLLFTVGKEIEAKEITQRGIAAGSMVLFLLFLRIRVKANNSASPPPERAT
jgi:hypothetical protein